LRAAGPADAEGGRHARPELHRKGGERFFMDITSAFDLRYATSGFGVGMLVGMTGVGGGSLMTPLLILIFGVHPATAVGTDLLYASATKTAGTLVHGIARTIDWTVVGRLALGSVPSTAVTLLALSRFDIAGPALRDLIAIVLSIALFSSAALLLFRHRLQVRYATQIGALSPRSTGWLTVAAGTVLGVLVSISSVGAGAIGVSILILLYPRLPTPTIVGSDIAHAVPLTLLAGCGHWMLGSIDWQLLGSLLVGSLPGIAIGSYLAIHVSESLVRAVLAVTLLTVGSRLAVEQFHRHLPTTAWVNH
jgi:uncharacterized protein